MVYVPKVFQDCEELIEELENAERILKQGQASPKEASRLEKILRKESGGLEIVRMHPEISQRIESAAKALAMLNPAENKIQKYTHQGIEFEKYAVKQSKGVVGIVLAQDSNGIGYDFGSSLNRLKGEKYERHPLPYEICSLLIAGMEGKLSGDESGVEQNILNTDKQFVSLAFKYSNDILHCYEHPINIKGSDFSQMEYSADRVFRIGSHGTSQGIKLKTLKGCRPELVEYLFSKRFEELPVEIRDRGALQLTNKPAAVVFTSNFYICADNYAPSRGVKAKERKTFLTT